MGRRTVTEEGLHAASRVGHAQWHLMGPYSLFTPESAKIEMARLDMLLLEKRLRQEARQILEQHGLFDWDVSIDIFSVK